MTACAPTTRNRASAADKADNRSLKSRLIAMVPPDSANFRRHLPGCGKSALRPDAIPEFQVKGAVVLRRMTEEPDHTDGFTAFRAHAATDSRPEPGALPNRLASEPKREVIG